MTLVIHAMKTDNARRSSLEYIRTLMERRDFNVDYQEPESGETLLVFAIHKKREDVARELILRGANIERARERSFPPLLTACSRNLVSTAQALVQAGADINRETNYTPLGLAASRGFLSMVRLMLVCGADPSHIDWEQQTARSLAQHGGHSGVIWLLDAWGQIQVMLVVRSAEQVRRLGSRSALKFLPKDLCRMIGSMLVRL
jgi:hypothetical protein